MTKEPLPLDQGLFGRLRRDAGTAWDDYVTHDFVRALGGGTLPEPAFRHFLLQDYLFLIHFARAWALAAFKATQRGVLGQGWRARPCECLEGFGAVWSTLRMCA